MKIKILLLLTLAIGLIFSTANAQKIDVKRTISPASFTAEDEVTIQIDITGTGFGSDLYIWLWSNAGDALTNGGWGDSKDAAKFTLVSPNILEYKFVGTTAFGKSAQDLKSFNFLVKTKDGSKQSPDYMGYAFDPIVFTETVFRIYPLKVSQTDVVTLYLNQKLSDRVEVQRMQPQTLSIKAYSGDNLLATKEGILITKVSEGVYSYSFIPTVLMGVEETANITKLVYEFKGKGTDATGKPIDVVTGGEFGLLDLN